MDAPESMQFISFVAFGFACFIVFAGYLLSIFDFVSLSNALRAGKSDYVEGQIVSYQAAVPPRRQEESFQVGGDVFTFSKNVETPAFRVTQSEGSPLREGLYVKIWHVRNKILRLETEDPASFEQKQPGSAQAPQTFHATGSRTAQRVAGAFLLFGNLAFLGWRYWREKRSAWNFKEVLPPLAGIVTGIWMLMTA